MPNDDFLLLRPTRRRFQDLRLCFCGVQECEPLHAWGPAVRPNYLLHYVLSGKGTYQAQGNTWRLGEGEGFLIEPEVLTFYQADGKDPWTYLWIGFEGQLAPELMEALGLSGGHLTFQCSRRQELRQVILALLRNDPAAPESELLVQSQLYLFFSILMRDRKVQAGAPGMEVNPYVQAAMDLIQAGYGDGLRVTDIAARIGVNRSYLSTLFRRELGISPQEYLTSFRLTRAAELLSGTAYSVENVALSCGYQDPLVFSKAFKQRYGITPLKYRQRARRDAQATLQQNPEELERLLLET